MADVQKWSIKGHWFDVCRCAIPCPCSWAEPPDDGYCEGILVWHIQEGHYGDLELDGLNVDAPTVAETIERHYRSGRDQNRTADGTDQRRQGTSFTVNP